MNWIFWFVVFVVVVMGALIHFNREFDCDVLRIVEMNGTSMSHPGYGVNIKRGEKNGC